MFTWEFAESLEADVLHAAARRALRQVPEELPAAMSAWGAPAAELAATPMSGRVALAALLHGHDFVHHELRRPVPPVGELETPRWVDGVFELSKYDQARLEAPLATYDPNHRGKWRPHELLHRSVGFFWRPDQTPFEVYLGARLSELLPVVHWYGFDEAYRPRCEAHRGRTLFREHCTRCESMQRPFWARGEVEEAEDALALEWIQRGLDHYAGECAIIDAERGDGRRRSSPRGPLDASSDALAYAEAHWDRLNTWSFGAWIELFCTPGVDYARSIAEMRERSDAALRRAFCAPLEYDEAAAKRRRDRQALRELGFRVLTRLEGVDDPQTEAQLWPALEAAGAACRVGADDNPRGQVDCVEAELALREALARAGAKVEALEPSRLLALGASWRPDRGADPELRLQIGRGLASGLPDRGEAFATEPLRDFIESAAFEGPGELRARWIRFLGQPGDSVEPGSSEAAWALEAFVRGRPLVDPEAKAFGSLPEVEGLEGSRQAWPKGRLRAHATYRRGSFGADTVARVLGWRPSDPVAELVRICIDGEPRVIEVDEELRAYLDSVDGGELPPLDEISLGLLESRVWVWLPMPR